MFELRLRTLTAMSLAAAAALSGCRRHTNGQTVVIADVASQVPLACVVIHAVGPGGSLDSDPIKLPAAWMKDPRHQDTLKVGIFSGGVLGTGAIKVTALGTRGDKCPGDAGAKVVAKAAEGTATFVEGDSTNQIVNLNLKVVGVDMDGDGYAAPPEGDDCDDTNPNIFPGAPENCAMDSIDWDCSGIAGHGCSCGGAAIRPCYPSHLGLRDPKSTVGECHPGTQQCDATGNWATTCDGAQLPQKAMCDTTGTGQKDYACDGILPTSCPCIQGTSRDCYTAGPANVAGVGACAKGVQFCLGGDKGYGSCGPGLDASGNVSTQANLPPLSVELCNGIDDNCNGQVDERFDADHRRVLQVPYCGNQNGVCALAQHQCVNGQVVPAATADCTDAEYRANNPSYNPGASNATDECAAQADLNCDGKIAEGCPCTPGSDTMRPCYPLGLGHPTEGKGACHDGTQLCQQDMTWGACTGFQGPTPELCDGIDNDCDGVTDNLTADTGKEEGTACGTGKMGICQPGEWRCTAGKLECTSLEQPMPAACNGVDNACNGMVNAGFDTRSDATHCGAACVSCALNGKSEANCCTGACSDPLTDSNNCGSCGTQCGTDHMGACCPSSADATLGACTQLETDKLNCGGCGNVCGGSTPVCRRGRCVEDVENAAAGECADLVDNNLDGQTDCKDRGCGFGVACKMTTTAAGVCRFDTVCVPKADGTGCDTTAVRSCYPVHDTDCTNGLDDAHQGLIDCADAVGCPSAPAGDDAHLTNCKGTTAWAVDGKTYANQCRQKQCIEYHEQPTECADLVDNNLDGLTDCQSADCLHQVCDTSQGYCLGTATPPAGAAYDGDHPQCAHETSCSDGRDNDQDGRTDCADEQDCALKVCDAAGGICFKHDQRATAGIAITASYAIPNSGGQQAACVHEADCTDNVDNDQDGLTDCDDNDCTTGVHACDAKTIAGVTGSVPGTCITAAAAAAGGGFQATRPFPHLAVCAHETSCADKLDNDGDGLTDCLDQDCFHAACDTTAGLCLGTSTPPTGAAYPDSTRPQCAHETACNDNQDNDSDGLTDCDDNDCLAHACDGVGTPAPGNCISKADSTAAGTTITHPSTYPQGSACAHEANCSDGVDNDKDGLTDCLDGDCLHRSCDGTFGVCLASSVAPAGAAYPDPTNHPQCAHEISCGDGIDNDGDGATDCDDIDCTPASGPGKICDGAPAKGACLSAANAAAQGNNITSLKPAFPQGSVCAHENTCFDGVDNDNDGLTDCADPDCEGVINPYTVSGQYSGLQCVGGSLVCNKTSCDGCCTTSGGQPKCIHNGALTAAQCRLSPTDATCTSCGSGSPVCVNNSVFNGYCGVCNTNADCATGKPGDPNGDLPTCDASTHQCTSQCATSGSTYANCGGVFTCCGSSGSSSPGTCVNKQTDTFNCGVCGGTCIGSTTCTSGLCTCSATETANCSTAANKTQCSPCSSGQSCSAGSCTCASAANCPNAPETCAGGQCTTCSASVSSTQGLACRGPAGTTCCGNGCIDMLTDANNCGACGNKCGSGFTCNSGVCQCSVGSDCSNVSGSPQCSGSVPSQSTKGICCPTGKLAQGGQCVSACSGGTPDLCTQNFGCVSDCTKAAQCPITNATCAVCIDTTSDAKNCSACGTQCASGQTCSSSVCSCTTANDCPHAGDVCSSNKCVSCTQGGSGLDKLATKSGNICCGNAVVGSSSSNCCGNADCTSDGSKPTCDTGGGKTYTCINKCGSGGNGTCNSNFCCGLSGTCVGGVGSTADTTCGASGTCANCLASGKACSNVGSCGLCQADPDCGSSYVCDLPMSIAALCCPSGQVDCGTGCHVAGPSVQQPCGGSVCSAASAACVASANHITCVSGCAACTSGSCVCGSNADCGASKSCLLPSDGTSPAVCCTTGQILCGSTCTSNQTDTNNCGTCGNKCGAAQTCNAGVCTCPASTPTACGSGASATCVNTVTDATNCGGCGVTCGSGQTCNNGLCTCTGSVACPGSNVCITGGGTSGICCASSKMACKNGTTWNCVASCADSACGNGGSDVLCPNTASAAGVKPSAPYLCVAATSGAQCGTACPSATSTAAQCAPSSGTGTAAIPWCQPGTCPGACPATGVTCN